MKGLGQRASILLDWGRDARAGGGPSPVTTKARGTSPLSIGKPPLSA